MKDLQVTVKPKRNYQNKDKLEPNNDLATFGQNRVVFDYLSFTTKLHNEMDIIEYLGFDYALFTPCAGMNMYRDGLEFGGVKVFFDGRSKKAEMGVNVVMSGKGCRLFEEKGTGDYMGLFKFIIDTGKQNPGKKLMNITRLDIAYDDFKGLLPLKQISEDARELRYVSRCHRNRDVNKHGAGYILKGDVDISEGVNQMNLAQDEDPAKRYKGMTVYFGTRKSDLMLRFYDKKAEQERTDIELWVRCEIQLRRNCAMGFIRRLVDGEEVRHLYFGVLNQYIRFVEVSETDRNRRRWKTAAYWDKFLEHGEEAAIFEKPGGTYTEEKLCNYVVGMAGKSFTTLAAIMGLNEVVKAIREEVKNNDEISKKHEMILKTKFGEKYREKFYSSLDYQLDPHDEFSRLREDVKRHRNDKKRGIVTIPQNLRNFLNEFKPELFIRKNENPRYSTRDRALKNAG
jgi:phage replication initiation protein